MKKRLLSFALSAAMILSLLPHQTLAVNGGNGDGADTAETDAVHPTSVSTQSMIPQTPSIHQYEYTGILEKTHDGGVVVFDPSKMKVDGKLNAWRNVSQQKNGSGIRIATAYWRSHASGHQWPCEAVDNLQPSMAFPSLPGRYSLIIYEPEDAQSGVNVHEVYRQEFVIKAAGLADGSAVKLPLKQNIERSDGYHMESIGTLWFVINADGKSLTLYDLEQQESAATTARLAVPESVWVGDKEYTVTAIADKAFTPKEEYGPRNFDELSLPKTIKTIGERAFSGLTWCRRLLVDESNPDFRHWEWAGGSALYNHDLTKLIAVPAHAEGGYQDALHVGNTFFSEVTEIAPFAFEGSRLVDPDWCTDIPDSVVTIGKGAFLGTTEIKSLRFGTGLSNLGWDEKIGFGFPDSLRLIDVNELNTNYKAIGGLLYNHDGTELLCCPAAADYKVELITGVNKIRANAFKGCTSVSGIYIPYSLTEIDTRSFMDMSSLQGFSVDENNPVYTSVDGMLIRNGGTLSFYPMEGHPGAYSLPESITTIGSNAFPEGSWMGDLTMTGPYAILQKDAFRGTALHLITGPGTEVRSVDPGAFDGAEMDGIDILHTGSNYASVDGQLTSADRKTLIRVLNTRGQGGEMQEEKFSLPATIETVSTGAFRDFSFPGIELEHVRTIQTGAFEHCRVNSLYLGKDLSSLDDRIFRNCAALDHDHLGPSNTLIISYAGTEAQWSSLTAGKQICIPDENLPWSPHRPIMPDEGYMPLTTEIRYQARRLDLRDCYIYVEGPNHAMVPKYPSVGEQVAVIPLDDSGGNYPVSEWRCFPSVDFKEEVRQEPGQQGEQITVAVFTMPDADLKIEAIHNYSGRDLPIQEIDLTTGVTFQGFPTDGKVSGSQNAHYQVTSAVWHKAVKDQSGNYIESGETVSTFGPEQAYIVKVLLTADTGYAFHPHGTNVRINGKTTEVSYKDQTYKTVTVSYVCLPRTKVAVTNGMAAGTNMKYDSVNGVGESYVVTGEPLYVWPVFKTGTIGDGTNVSDPDLGTGVITDCGTGSIKYDAAVGQPMMVQFGSRSGPVNAGNKIIHTFMADAYEGILDSSQEAQCLSEARPGSKITIRAAAFPSGYKYGWQFDHWEIYDTFNPTPGSGTGSSSIQIQPNDPAAEQTWFTMPDCEVFIEAVYRKPEIRYSLKIENAIISSNSDEGRTENEHGYLEVAAGAKITLRPDMPAGQNFGGWKANYRDVVMSGNTFIMPDHDVEIRAIPDISEYSVLRILGGVAKNEHGEIINAAKKGMEITLSYDKPAEGQKFDHWEYVPDGVRIDGSTFVMGDKPVTVRAVFHTHIFGEWIQDPAGHTRTCSCGLTETADHVFTDWVTNEEGTEMRKTCLICGYVHTETVQKTDDHHHTPSTEWSSDAAGHWHYCTDTACDAQLDYSAHSFGEWTQDPDYSVNGKKIRECTVCHYVDTAYDPVSTTNTTTAVAAGAFQPEGSATENVTVHVDETAQAPSSVTYDQKAVDSINNSIQDLNGTGPAITSMQVRIENITDNLGSGATAQQKDAIKNIGSGEVLSIALECLDADNNVVEKISSFGEEGACTIRIPAPDWFDPDSPDHAKTVTTVYRVEEDGTLTAMRDVRYEQIDGRWYIVWFSSGHSIYMIANPNLYGRNELTPQEQKAYDLFGQGVAKKVKALDLTALKLSPAQLSKIVTFYINDHPEHYWLRGGYSYNYWNRGNGIFEIANVMPNYFNTFMNDALFQQGTAKLLSAAEGKTSDYDKALALHDALVKNTSYVMNAPNAHNAYGVIAEGKAVCEGYARAYQYLLQQVGIQSYVVTGIAGGGGHAWNLVRLDGNYYYTDTTWDDPTIGADEAEKPVFYGYFNLPEVTITRDHKFDELYSSIKPIATDTTMLYEDYAVMAEPDPIKIADKLCKLDPAGTQLVSRMFCPSEDAYNWLSTGYSDIAEAAGIVGGYSVNWVTCGNEIYMNYRVEHGQSYRPFSGQTSKPAIERPTNGRFAQPYAESASEMLDGVELKLEKDFPGGDCLIAIYSEDGKVLSIGMKTIPAKANKTTVNCGRFDPNEAKTVKVFLLGDGAAPIKIPAFQMLTK